jgi:hypothetical protein
MPPSARAAAATAGRRPPTVFSAPTCLSIDRQKERIPGQRHDLNTCTLHAKISQLPSPASLWVVRRSRESMRPRLMDLLYSRGAIRWRAKEAQTGAVADRHPSDGRLIEAGGVGPKRIGSADQRRPG